MYAFLACAFKTNDYTLSVGMCFNENKTPAMYVFHVDIIYEKKSGHTLSRRTRIKQSGFVLSRHARLGQSGYTPSRPII